MDIKPIETHYNGYKFRSRLEARWAVYFDEMGIKYEYEKEGYDLGEAGWYLPDFWLPEYQMWIEVKPVSPTEIERRKMDALINGLCPKGDEYINGFFAIGAPSEESVCFDGIATICYYAIMKWGMGVPYWGRWTDFDAEDIDAFVAARSARFEH